MYKTTEITSDETLSDLIIHQRLYFAYVAAQNFIDKKLIEIGCGIGRGIDLLMANTVSYTAIDKNGTLLNHLQNKYPSGIFIEQNIPPFSDIPSDTYDSLVSFQVIEHIKDDKKFISEVHRVLKPGGKAIISTPNRLMSLSRNPWHIREYTDVELHSLCSQNFQKIEMFGVYGNETILKYHSQNKESVDKIMRWDFLNLQYRLPSTLLRFPYDVLNRINRKKLLKQDSQLILKAQASDFTLKPKTEECFDLFMVLTK